jgi:hypothetical protein
MTLGQLRKWLEEVRLVCADDLEDVPVLVGTDALGDVEVPVARIRLKADVRGHWRIVVYTPQRLRDGSIYV